MSPRPASADDRISQLARDLKQEHPLMSRAQRVVIAAVTVQPERNGGARFIGIDARNRPVFERTEHSTVRRSAQTRKGDPTDVTEPVQLFHVQRADGSSRCADGCPACPPHRRSIDTDGFVRTAHPPREQEPVVLPSRVTIALVDADENVLETGCSFSLGHRSTRTDFGPAALPMIERYAKRADVKLTEEQEEPVPEPVPELDREKLLGTVHCSRCLTTKRCSCTYPWRDRG